MQITPDEIKELRPNEIYVFASNYAGRHIRGTALRAWKEFGAEWGVGLGRTGQCYAIATRNRLLNTVVPEMIGWQAARFKRYASENPDLRFFLTAVGCGSCGFGPQDIAHFFFNCPSNVTLPATFIDQYRQ